MSTLLPDSGGHAADDPDAARPTPAIDYAAAEGLDGTPPSGGHLVLPTGADDADRRSWTFVAIGLVGLVALIAALVSIVALATGSSESQTVAAAPAAAHTDHAAATETAAAPTAADAKG
jgi:hypothetical protein